MCMLFIVFKLTLCLPGLTDGYISPSANVTSLRWWGYLRQKILLLRIALSLMYELVEILCCKLSPVNTTLSNSSDIFCTLHWLNWQVHFLVVHVASSLAVFLIKWTYLLSPVLEGSTPRSRGGRGVDIHLFYTKKKILFLNLRRKKPNAFLFYTNSCLIWSFIFYLSTHWITCFGKACSFSLMIF